MHENLKFSSIKNTKSYLKYIYINIHINNRQSADNVFFSKQNYGLTMAFYAATHTLHVSFYYIPMTDLVVFIGD